MSSGTEMNVPGTSFVFWNVPTVEKPYGVTARRKKPRTYYVLLSTLIRCTRVLGTTEYPVRSTRSTPVRSTVLLQVRRTSTRTKNLNRFS